MIPPHEVPPEGWPFDDPPNVAVFTTEDVLAETAEVMYVTHEAEDGAWQFLPGEGVNADAIRVVALTTILARDPTLVQVASLPIGWTATRPETGSDWLWYPS